MIQGKLFTTENTNDCTDAGGRATHGAVAEDTEKRILLTQPIRISVLSAIAPASPKAPTVGALPPPSMVSSVSSVVTLGFFLI
jgi:hypothetical protein